MARVRGGNTGIAAALVFFVCAFVISLLVAIILYTKIETHKTAEESAKDEVAKYVKNGGEAAAAGEFMADGKSAVGGLLARLQEQQDLIALKDREIGQLNAQITRKDSAFNNEATIKEQVETQLAAERAQFATVMKQRQDQVNALITEKDGLVKQIGDLQSKVNTDIGNADASARDRIAELTTQVGELENKIREQDDAMKTLSIAMEVLRQQLPKLPDPNSTLPDGQVASVFDNGRDLFINLGRSDGLVIGMTFEIFDPLPVIRLSNQGEARGKATIEVYSLDSTTATCRVVRMDRGEQIDPGDPIVNISYDPKMDIAIFAFGYFDIERDGGSNDIERIRGLVSKNGGRVAELKANEDGIPVLTPDLDYVVLGAEPILPDKPGADDFDPEKIAEYQARQAELEAYFRIVDDAKLMRIPVLSMNRFLELSGYYTR